MKYPYLLFDADNTLFDFDAAEKNAHRQVCGKHRLAFTEEGYALYRRCNAQLWQDFDRGLCSKEFLLPGAEALCRRLAAGHELYLVTNAVESVQRARFERSAIRPYFRDVFISEAIGCGKPSPAYFAYVLRAVPGLTAENGLVIGDSLTSDIQGANNAGLACCWFNPKGLPRPDGLRIDYEVRTLEEIADLV